jgi:NAD(P)H-hydrate epimerase
MKIASAEQVRELDQQTIQKEPISSYALMERASAKFAEWFVGTFHEDKPVFVFCGKGNNGGDGLAVARMLQKSFFTVTVIASGNPSSNRSEDNQKNLGLLIKEKLVRLHFLDEISSFPEIPKGAIIIDAMFGSGLNRPLEGFYADLVEKINHLQNCEKVAIDMPSGLMADKYVDGPIVRADYTFSFELPKLAFLFPENQGFVGEWKVQSIGLLPSAIERLETPYFLLEKLDLEPHLKKRMAFDHKGSYGHSLIIGGSYGKIGAVILSSRACLRSGCGLVTVHVPKCAYEIMQISFPEAMVQVDRHKFVFSEIPNLKPYKAVGIGCGLGTNQLSADGLEELLDAVEVPLVMDADALNLLANNPGLMAKVPKGSVLTPHPGEFERLFGKTSNSFDRLNVLKGKAQDLKVYIILKGKYTAIACPDGKVFFNPTGNPGMATGGSGDVLTGILTGLLAQGYKTEDACKLGVFLHGLSGDIALEKTEQESLLASDLIENIGKAFKSLRAN